MSSEGPIPPASYAGGHRDGLYGWPAACYRQFCPEYDRGYDDGVAERLRTGAGLMPRPGPTLWGHPIIFEGGPAAQPPGDN